MRPMNRMAMLNPNEKPENVPSVPRLRGVLLFCIASALLGTPIRGQEIHIRVLNARTGKPISNECVNLSLGAWHGADLIAPTNKEGVAVLRLARNEVAADIVSPSPCERTAIVGPKPLP